MQAPLDPGRGRAARLQGGPVVRVIRERRIETPDHSGHRPANAYLEGANSLIQSIKREVRGFRNVERLATAILPGWETCRSMPSTARRSSPCYLPGTPKNPKSWVLDSVVTGDTLEGLAVVRIETGCILCMTRDTFPVCERAWTFARLAL